MLELFLLHLIILSGCTSAGFLFYEFTGIGSINRRSGILNFLTGLIFLTIIAQVIVLFYPINGFVQLVLAVLLIAGVAWKQKRFIPFVLDLRNSLFKMKAAAWITIAAGWLLALLIGAGYTINADTDAYHIQMVKWISEYGTVPGLVNLHTRYGFNSSWFTSIALLTPHHFHGQFYTALNSLVSVVFVIYLIRRMHRPLLALAAAFVLVLILTAWPIIRGNAASANYDLFTSLVILVIFVECLSVFLERKTGDQNASDGLNSGGSWKSLSASLPLAELILWPAFLFTVRITNFPMLLLSVGAVVLMWRSAKRQMPVMIAFSTVAIIAFLARNVMLSGYLFYPSMAFDFFQVDWKADRFRTDFNLYFIRQYNRVNNQYQTLETTAAMSYPQWIARWFEVMFTYDRRLLLVAVAGYAAGIIALVKKTFARGVVFLIAILTGQLMLWFFVAPDPRFVYGPILCGCFLLQLILFGRTSSLLRKAKQLLSQPIFAKATVSSSILLKVVAVVAVALLGYTGYQRQAQLPLLLVRPFDLPTPPVVTVYFNGIPVSVTCAQSTSTIAPCYGTNLPCAYEVYPGLEARGKRVQDGFRLSEKRIITKPFGL